MNCPNFNHRRADAPVRGCPSCGEIVNAKVVATRCSDAEHATRRRSGDRYCVGCNEQLRT